MHHPDHCLWGYTLPPYCFVFSSLLSLPFRKMEALITSGSAWVCCHKDGTACAFNASNKSPDCFECSTWSHGIILIIEIPGGAPCCLDEFARNILESLKKGTSEQTESTRDHDYTSITCIPAWVQPRPQMMLCQPQLVLK